MAATFDKPTPLQRIAPIFQGFDGWLLFAILLMAGAGLITMYSVGFDHGTRFSAHSRNMMLAVGLMFLVSQVPPQRLMSLALPLYAVGVMLLLGVEFFGIMRKGSQRWLDVGVTVIQPSELMKIAMPLMLSWWFHRREGQLKPLDFVVAGFLLVIPVALIIKQPDLGTSLLVLSSGLFVIFFAGLSWKLILPPLVIGAVAVVTLIALESQMCAPGVDWKILHEYQRQRVCTLLDPSKDPLGKGFHIIQGMIAIGSGGVWGKGFMQGTQTHLEFIPERTTDFIYAAFSEEFGLVGVLCLMGGFIFLIVRGLLIAVEAPTQFARLLAGAVTLNVFVYAFVNMGMVSGILPVVGVPLPFVSYGGTAMVTLGVGLGILMSVAKSKRLMQS
ncbi:rod shape-determining protein RodA [Hydrogenophaga sp. 2FB]|uniref:rod shape-determining protein RodA n=1 Tax=Hydrogenophaga sp. 2FB TaxID=2502187 RepID=UPI0010F9B363|nr:rod shape-determining protein RodA [Hydrogenophaga sp. 2FB]